MAINFPNSPVSGATHTVSGKIWQWDGEKWKAYGASIAPSILKIDTTNNRVGINQTTPTVALDVTGAMRVTGDLTIEGTTTTIESTTIAAQTSLTFEGATADDFETTLTLVDPTADRTITLPDATGTVALTGAVPTAITVADTTDTTAFVALWESATGDLAPKSDAGITYNAGTGTLTATAFAGPLTGNVTGNASGTALTVTQAAQTAITSVGTLTSLAVSGGLVAPLAINTQTAAYTLVLADAGKLIEMNVGSANNLTIPTNASVAFDVGTQIVVVQLGAGVTTIVGASGVGLNSKDDLVAIAGQKAAVTLIKRSSSDWWIFGALA